MEDRENNLAMMRYVLEMAKDLDVNLVKVFAAWPGLINDEEEITMYAQFDRPQYFKRLYPPALRKWNHCVEGIREIADIAADMGITLALQNHAPVLSMGYEDTLIMMQEIDRKNVKLCIDVLFSRSPVRRIRARSRSQMRKKSHPLPLRCLNFSQNKDGEIIQIRRLPRVIRSITRLH